MSLPRAYTPHQAFVAPARAHPQLWRFLAGFVLASVTYVVLARIYFRSFYDLFGGMALGSEASVTQGDTPLGMYVLLFSFAFMAFGAALSARLLHHRGFRTLLGPLPTLLERDFNLPPLAELLEEIAQIRELQDRHQSLPAEAAG